MLPVLRFMTFPTKKKIIQPTEWMKGEKKYINNITYLIFVRWVFYSKMLNVSPPSFLSVVWHLCFSFTPSLPALVFW